MSLKKSPHTTSSTSVSSSSSTTTMASNTPVSSVSTTPQKASSSTRQTNVDNFFSITPEKKNTSQKCSTLHSPAGSLKKASPIGSVQKLPASESNRQSDIQDLQNSMKSFREQFDTQLRASLYSLSENDVGDAKETIKCMRTTLNAFYSHANGSLSNAVRKSNSLEQKHRTLTQYCSTLEQKNAKLTQYCSHLSMEKNELASKVKTLKREVEEAKLETLNMDVIFSDTEDMSNSQDDPGNDSIELLNKQSKKDDTEELGISQEDSNDDSVEPSTKKTKTESEDQCDN